MFLALEDWSPSWLPCGSPNAHPTLSLAWDSFLLNWCSLRGRCVCFHIFSFVFPREILWLNSRHILHHFAINCWVFTYYSNIKQDKKYSVAIFSFSTTWCLQFRTSALTITCDKTGSQRWLQHWLRKDLLLSSGQTFDHSDEETARILLSPAFTSSAVFY